MNVAELLSLFQNGNLRTQASTSQAIAGLIVAQLDKELPGDYIAQLATLARAIARSFPEVQAPEAITAMAPWAFILAVRAIEAKVERILGQEI